MQYVGKLMRTFDTTHVREIVEAAQRGHTVKTAEFHRLEKVREALVDGDDELMQQLFDAHPEQGQRFANSYWVPAEKKPRKNRPRIVALYSNFCAACPP